MPLTPPAIPQTPPAPPHPLARSYHWLRQGPHVRRIALTLLLVTYAILLLSHFAPAICEPDDNGYFAQGSLLARTGGTSFESRSDAQYIGMHWLLAPSGQYISRYPPGLAVLIGGVYAALGFKASVLVNPALGLLALGGFYLLVRQILPAGWAFAGVVLLGGNPVFFHHALGCDSHVAVLACLVWGLYLLLRWSETGRRWQVFVAGLILGCIPSIRYADAVLGLGVMAFLLWHTRRPGIWRDYLAAAAGAALPLIPLMVHNQRQLGAFWRTGYSLTNEQTGFSLDYFQSHAVDYIHQLLGGGVGLFFALGLVGATLMICLRPWRKLGVTCVLLAVPLLLVYMAYYWAPQGIAAMTMRFVLPTFPVYLLAGLWALDRLTHAAPRGARVAVPLTVIGLQLLWGTRDLLQNADRLFYQRQTLAQLTDALRASASPGDVVIADNQVLQHLDFVREWKLADESAMRGRMGPDGPMGGPGGPDAGPPGESDRPSPGQGAKQRLRSTLYTGTQAERQAKFREDVMAWADTGRIFIVGTASSVEQALGGSRHGTVKILQRITLAEPPQMTGPRAAAGGARNARNVNRPGAPGGAAGGFAGGPGGMAPGPFGGPGAFGGPGGGPGGPGGGPGGFMGMRGGEIVIAEWIPKPTGSSANSKPLGR